MKRKKKTPRPLVALENTKYNYPDVWEKVTDISTATEFCRDNGVPESRLVIAALAKWRRSKQIFEIDEELCEILKDTDKVNEEIPVEIIDRLVYESFYVKFPEEYIRFTNNEGEFDVDGFFYFVSDKSIIFVFLFTSGHTQSIRFDIEEGLSLKQCIDKYMKVSPDVYLFTNFCIQIVLYLCADNADIEENYIQKQIHKPSTGTIKDVYSEVRKWDVGFRYGKAVRKTRGQTTYVSSLHHEGSHARKRTHVRKGHYHHFWRGSKTGKRELILKWISPVVINAEYENVATIHKVKKEENP